MVFKKANAREPKLVDYVSDSDDESIDEDLAFNSDDEEKYGSIFAGSKPTKNDSASDTASNSSEDEKSYSGDEGSDGIASDDDDDDGDGGQFMLDLLNNLDNKDGDKQKEKDEARREMAHSKFMAESEYSTAVKSSNLTLDQLMSNIADTKGFGTVQKTMKGISSDSYDGEKHLTTTSAPVSKVVSSRAERKVNYQEQKNEVSQWTTVTKQNREAETLDFRPKDRIRITKDELVGKFEPTTDFEKEMANALEEAGIADESKMKNMDDDMFDDDDDLGRNNLTEEEFRRRHGELAKMRALMFYEEQKRNRVNKIKSKKYRKIRKKQRMRLKEAENAEAAEHDDEYAKELEEKAELERMQERMSLKHRNTSKWAKRVLRRGKNVDMDTRRALSEQVRIGDELKRKMQGHFSDDSEDEDADLLEKARAILAETEEDAQDEKKKGLFSMDFMKKGLEAQRQRAKAEARELLKELEANAEASEDENQDEESDETSASKKKKPKVASAKEMEKVISKGKLTAASLEFGNSNTVAVSGEIDLEIGSKSTKKVDAEAGNSMTISLSQVEAVEADQVQEGESRITTGLQAKTSKRNHSEEEDSNPWVQNASIESNTEDSRKAKKLKKVLPRISKQGIVNVADAVNILSGDVDTIDESKKSEKTETVRTTNVSSAIATLTQEELVKKAFATPSEKDIEDDFEKEKESMREREDPTKKKKEDNKCVSGWGSWAGEGAPPPRPRKLPKHLKAPEKKIEKRRRKDDGKKNVIISAKRVKKSAKFQMENVPYPYSSREQYDRAMAGSIGAEWNVSGAVKSFTRADVVTRAGKMIRPISKKAKMKRAPLAKFK